MNFNQKDSNSYLYHIVSVGMVIAGFVTRVAPMLWFWKHIFKGLVLPCNPVAWPIQVFAIVDSIIFDVYNLLIVYKMLKGCVKHFIWKTKSKN